MSAAGAGPLAGLRVIDLTTMVAGPLATMVLADQGADVIKVESPKGDLMRHYGAMIDGESAAFLSCNRGKRGLCLDLKTGKGVEIVRRLAASADVLVQNFRPGTIERLGLGEPEIRQVRRDIVYVSISGVGERGPYASQRVYDPVIQALSGLAELQADREGPPRPRMVRTVVPDKTTALTAAQAITAALYHRERTGEGQHVRLSMLDAMIAYLWPEAMSSLSFVGRESDPAAGQMGLDLVFRTCDGYITAGAVSDLEWVGLCRALDRLDLLEDARFETAQARSRNAAPRRSIMAQEIARWSSAAILQRLSAQGVPCAPIVSRLELLESDQLRTSGTLQVIEDERLGAVRQPRPAARFDRTPPAIRKLAPARGEDNEAVLAALGYSHAEILELRGASVIA